MPEKNESKQLFRVGPIFVKSMGSAEMVLTSLSSNAQMVIPKSFLKILTQCLKFKSLDRHAKDIWASFSILEKARYLKPIFDKYSEIYGEAIIGFSGFERMLKGILKKFNQDGFLVSQDTFFNWASGQTPSAEHPQSIQSVGVVTKNRPEALQKCLSSYIEGTIKKRRDLNYLIFDDSSRQGYM